MSEFKGTKGKWYFGDSTKKFGYKIGQWIKFDLYTRFSNKELDTACIGSVSFSGKAGLNKDDYKFCETNMKLIVSAPELLEALEHISNIQQAKGTNGCTWGDTNFDSVSAAYGYNQCLEYLQEIALKAIKKATE